MAREDIAVMMAVVWTITLISTSIFYFICMGFAYGLTEKKWSVLNGSWFLSPGDFPTAEGKLWCKRGGICMALMAGLFLIQMFAWRRILDFFAGI